MRLLTSKDGNLMSNFDKIKESEINDTSSKQTFINNHTVAAKKA